jgi:hypothetical protein
LKARADGCTAGGVVAKYDDDVDASGTLHSTEPSAFFAETHDEDVVLDRDEWPAKHRETTSGPMPTRVGDVVVHRIGSNFSVWLVTADDAQDPDRNVAPLQVESRYQAEVTARRWAQDTEGRIFWAQRNGYWTTISSSQT